MPTNLHICVTDKSSLFRREVSSSCFFVVSARGRPPFLPFACAASTPALTRSRVSSRSISENAAHIVNKTIPRGVVVSMLFSRATKLMCLALKSFISSTSFIILRPRRSRRITQIISPFLNLLRSRFSCVLSSLAPEIFSWKISSQPTSSNFFTWISKFNVFNFDL